MSYSKSRGRSNTSVKSSRSVTSSVGNPQKGSSSLESIRQDETTKAEFQRNAEEKKKLEKSENSEAELTFVPWRVFINHIDIYHGKKLAETLPGRTHVVDSQRQGDAGVSDVAFDTEGDPGDEKENKRATGKKRKNLTRARGNEENDFAEEEGEDEGENLSEGNVERRKFEIVGTVKDEEYERPENVTTVIRSSKNKELLLGELMKCGVVIYDITQDDSQISEAHWALEGIVEKLEKFRQEKPKAFELSGETRYFILISTVMTWALTKPLSPEDPDLAFTEADYRKRRPHPNFKEHIKCEREVSTIAKRTNLQDKLKTVVIGSGITYGDEEGPIHYLFKMGWKNAEYLPIFGRGNNKIPLLHVRDLVEVVCMLVEKWPKPKYIVAVEQELVSQATIVKKISKALTTGKVKHIAPEEAFLLPEVTQRIYDMMNTNINIEPAYVVDNALQWHWDMPFRDNVDALIKEYKISRNLFPVRIIVLGPPASGKTRLAQSLAKHYENHYISVKNLITETIEKLSKEVEAVGTASVSDVAKHDSAKVELDEVEEEDVGDDEEGARGVEEFQEQLDEIRNNLTENNGRLDDDILNKLFRSRLLSKDCENQGYVIDGYPKTISQARGLFGSSEDDQEIDEEEDDFGATSVTGGNRKILPELIVVLEAGDEFLIERVVALPENEIQGTHYNEEGMLRRLREYRERNTDEETPLQLFDELEVHPLVIAIEDDICPEMFSTFVQCIKRLGEPRNYGPTDAEREDAKRRVEAEARATSAIEEARKVREDFERKIARERKMMEWTDLLEKLKEEEAEKLSIIAEPLRHYLVKYIFPTLSQGLIEVSRLRPEDPIDFLAEYLFKENPGGKMFEPDYTETMSMLLSAIEKLQEDILPRSELDKGLTERYLKCQGQRGDQRLQSADEAGVFTEDDDDDDEDQDLNRVGCDGKRRTTTDRRGISSTTVDTTATSDKTDKQAHDTGYENNDAIAASSFSYEEIDDGSGKSFGNSTIHSRENSQ